MSSKEPDRPLRLLRGGHAPDHDGASRAVCSYTNRLGARYYLHVMQTKNGQTRFVPRKTVSEGALSEMPDGYDFDESLGGVVSVRRVEERSRVPMVDFQRVTAEVDRHRHLRGHVVERRHKDIMIHEPDPEPDVWTVLADPEFRVVPRANQPHVRPALCLVILGEWAIDGPKLYQARGPRDSCDLQWGVLGEGRLEDLLTRFVIDRDTSPLGRE